MDALFGAFRGRTGSTQVNSAAFTPCATVIPGMNATAFTRRCALLRASKDGRKH
jgi:hypothetical protein